MTDEEQIDGTTHAEKDANGDIVHNPDVVNTGEAQITNETLVLATRTSGVSNVPGGDWTTITDTEAADVRDEYSNSGEFTPDKTGFYDIRIRAGVTPNADQDDIDIRLVDSVGSSALFDRSQASGTGREDPNFTDKVELTAGESYTPEVRSSGEYDVAGDSATTRVSISWSVVQSP